MLTRYRTIPWLYACGSLCPVMWLSVYNLPARTTHMLFDVFKSKLICNLSTLTLLTDTVICPDCMLTDVVLWPNSMLTRYHSIPWLYVVNILFCILIVSWQNLTVIGLYLQIPYYTWLCWQDTTLFPNYMHVVACARGCRCKCINLNVCTTRNGILSCEKVNVLISLVYIIRLASQVLCYFMERFLLRCNNEPF